MSEGDVAGGGFLSQDASYRKNERHSLVGPRSERLSIYSSDLLKTPPQNNIFSPRGFNSLASDSENVISRPL